MEKVPADSPLAVLVSGGLDSAVLLGEALQHHPAVHPLYVRTGLLWESVELEHLKRFLAAMRAPALRPLQLLELPIADVYGKHWSITGTEVPDESSPDAAVFLPGRNVLLLSKGLLWCHLNSVPAIALALLEANPFTDATPKFFDAFSEAVNLAMRGRVSVLRPYAHLSKVEIIQRGRAMPLKETFSCIRPIAGRHCGRCNKCAERSKAFAAASVHDPTDYANNQS
jgi:7-cyano-7-deazaguanine synthase